MKVRCIHWQRCTKDCEHKSTHEVVSHGKYAHHNCKDERTLMCGDTETSPMSLDGNCQQVIKVA